MMQSMMAYLRAILIALLTAHTLLTKGAAHHFKASFSSNLLTEDRSGTYDVISHVIRQPKLRDDYHGDWKGNDAGNNMAQYYPQSLVLQRGSRLTVHVRLKELGLASLYRAVFHQKDGDDSEYVNDRDDDGEEEEDEDDDDDGGNDDDPHRDRPSHSGDSKRPPTSSSSSNLVGMFCPHPVPEMYNLTYEVVKVPCEQFSSDNLAREGMDRGHLSNKSKKSTLLCSRSSSLSHFLGLANLPEADIRENYDEENYEMENYDGICDDKDGNEINKNYMEKRRSSVSIECGKCLRLCALAMTDRRGGCNVTEDENEHQYKLPTCLSCCARVNCFNKCLPRYDDDNNNNKTSESSSKPIQGFESRNNNRMGNTNCEHDDVAHEMTLALFERREESGGGGGSSKGGRVNPSVVAMASPDAERNLSQIVRKKSPECDKRSAHWMKKEAKEDDDDCSSANRCRPMKAIKLKLKPIFPVDRSVFACHVKPSKDDVSYDVEYDVYYDEKIINREDFTKHNAGSAGNLKENIHKKKPNFKARKVTGARGFPYRTVDEHDFLKIHYGSNLKATIDLIEGNHVTRTFSAGRYSAASPGVDDKLTFKDGQLLVRPKYPFAVSSKNFGNYSCDDLGWLSALEPALDIRGQPTDPYHREPDITVDLASKHTYRLYHRYLDMRPYLFFEIPKENSIFGHFSNETLLLADESLKVNLTWDGKHSHWLLKVTGHVDRCPGVLQVKVKAYGWTSDGHSLLFFYDMIVLCPRSFEATFRIGANGFFGSRLNNQTFVVVLTDSFRSTRLVVHQPTGVDETEPTAHVDIKNDGSSKKASSVPWKMTNTMMITIIVIIVANISTFLIFLYASIIPRRNMAPLKKLLERFPNVLIVASVVCLRLLFSLFSTGTCFVCLTYHMSRGDVIKLANASSIISSLIEYSHSKMQSIQSEALIEIRRQNAMANQTRTKCFKKFEALQAKISKLHARIADKGASHEKKFAANLTTYVDKLFENINHQIKVYRKDFLNSTLPRMAAEFNIEVKQAASSILGSNWLKPARILHKAVKDKRSKLGLKSKSFLEFLRLSLPPHPADINVEVNNDDITKDLIGAKSKLLALIDTEFKHLNSKQQIKKFGTALPHNDWYIQNISTSGDTNSSEPSEENYDDKQSSGADNSKVDILWKYIFTTIFAIDCVFFVLRMTKTWKALKHFRPHRVDMEADSISSTSEDIHFLRKRNSVTSMDQLQDFFVKLWQTDYFLKVTASCSIVAIVGMTTGGINGLIHGDLLTNTGYLDAVVQPLERCRDVSMKLIELNQRRINNFEHQAFSELTLSKMKRFRLLVDAYSNLEKEWDDRSMAESCYWKEKIFSLMKFERKFGNFNHNSSIPSPYERSEKYKEEKEEEEDHHSSRRKPYAMSSPSSSSSSSTQDDLEPCLLIPVDVRPLKSLNLTRERLEVKATLQPFLKTLNSVASKAAQLLLFFLSIWSIHDNMTSILSILIQC